jgi:nicotinamidase-related amidase
MANKRCIVLVDFQNDFALPGAPLEVPGGLEDAARVADMINNNINQIDGVLSTLDSHYHLHIGHGVFWVDDQGNHPEPRTLITLDGVKSGKYRPSNTKDMDWVLEYLELGPNIIWPPHCIIGTEGQAMIQSVRDAVANWEITRGRVPVMHAKGSHTKTENFSAIKAKKAYPGDKSTEMQYQVVKYIARYDKIAIAGLAENCCVLDTCRDIADNMSDEEKAKVWILVDGMSSVTAPGLLTSDETQDEFEKMGFNSCLTTEFFQK